MGSLPNKMVAVSQTARLESTQEHTESTFKLSAAGCGFCSWASSVNFRTTVWYDLLRDQEWFCGAGMAGSGICRQQRGQRLHRRNVQEGFGHLERRKRRQPPLPEGQHLLNIYPKLRENVHAYTVPDSMEKHLGSTGEFDRVRLIGSISSEVSV